MQEEYHRDNKNQRPTTLNMLAWALYYRGLGLCPIPCAGKEGKGAIVEWGRFKAELPTNEEIIGWWKKNPKANIALVCGPHSGMLVIDVDQAGVLDGKHIPVTPQAISGGEGLAPCVPKKTNRLQATQFQSHRR